MPMILMARGVWEMKRVQVFPPQGPALSLTVSPNETVQQVAVKACQAFNLTGPWDLHAGKQVLCALLPIGQLAQSSFHLRPGQKQTSAMVTVALQHTERLVGEFTPATSISDILHSFAMGEGVMAVQCGRLQIKREAFPSTTLAMLGYLQGNCLLRVMGTIGRHDADRIEEARSGTDRAGQPIEDGAVQTAEIQRDSETDGAGQARDEEVPERKHLSSGIEGGVAAADNEAAVEKRNLQTAWVFREAPSRIQEAATLPDSHYQLDAHELKHYQAMAIRKTRQLTEAPLQLQRSRVPIPMAAPSHTRIKFHFPDGASLEVDQIETALSLAHLHTMLGSKVDLPFRLHLNGKLLSASLETSIAEAKLWPAVTLSVEWICDCKQYSISTQAQMKEIVAESGKQTKSVEDGVQAKSAADAKVREDEAGGGKVPKWLKLFKK